MKVVWLFIVLGVAAVLADPTTEFPPVSGFGRPVDCADYLMAGNNESGIYEIFPFTCTCSKGVKVWCDMETDGGGWTVFLNRQNKTNQLDFNRTWSAYKEGFGSPDADHWLGNELLHKMTFSREYALRADFVSNTGGLDYATYEKFQVDAEDNRYRSSASGQIDGGSYSRCLNYMNGRYFTTIDRDSDSYSGNCASDQGGGWWYYNCRAFNPTSVYNTSISLSCYYNKFTITSLQLKIRPSICDAGFKTIHLKDNACGC